MPIYTTRLLQENELEFAINFAWPIAQQRNYFYFPYYNTLDELSEDFTRFFIKKGLYLIGIFEGSILVALFPLVFRENEDIGGWDKGIYILDEKTNYSTAMALFKKFISNDLGFGGKKIYCGIRSDYQSATEYFKREDSELLEETYITSFDFNDSFHESLNREMFKLDPSIKILELNDTTNDYIYNSYFEYHDKAYPGYYWTSERLKKHLQDFRVIIAYMCSAEQEVTILGGIFVREIEGTGDVYGLSIIGVKDSDQYISATTERSDTLREALFHKALQNGHENGLKLMMFFCEEIDDYHLAIQKGFKAMGNYTLYLWDLNH